MRVAVCGSKPLPETMITFCQFVSKILRNKIDYDWSQTPEVFSPQCVNKSGPWFNIKMSSYRYRKSHCGDKTVVRSSYLHNGISYTSKMASFYWISPQEVMMFDMTWYCQVMVQYNTILHVALYRLRFEHSWYFELHSLALVGDMRGLFWVRWRTALSWLLRLQIRSFLGQYGFQSLPLSGLNWIKRRITPPGRIPPLSQKPQEVSQRKTANYFPLLSNRSHTFLVYNRYCHITKIQTKWGSSPFKLIVRNELTM